MAWLKALSLLILICGSVLCKEKTPGNASILLWFSKLPTSLPSGESYILIDKPIVDYGKKTIQHVTRQIGASVFLPCTTKHTLERQAPQVSWIRKKDWHILTSGSKLYTKEERFSVHHSEGSNEWTLAIKYLNLNDSGAYECQIATGNGLNSHLVNLDVVVPRAYIPGNGEFHVEAGSIIKIDCFIEKSPIIPQYIFWYHNNRMINYDRERGGVSVQITPGPEIKSTLTMVNAKPSDSGNYTCAAANTNPASLMVYITAADKIAAIQPRASDGAEPSFRSSRGVVSASLLSVVILQIFIKAQTTPNVRRNENGGKRGERCHSPFH